MGWNEFPPPLPFPDGEGIMGFRDGRVRQGGSPETNWKEYAGACLLSPLIADTPYVFEFYVGFVTRLKSPDINITFFGTTDCSNLPFGVGDADFGCPTNGPGWQRLGSSFVSGGAGNKWVKTNIHVTPDENITAIAIGPDCPAVESPVSIYYFFDNLTLVDLRSFQFQITGQTHPCAENFRLSVLEQPGFTYQWYKDGIALPGEISSQIKNMYGEGQYQVMVRDGASCSITGVYPHGIPTFTNDVHVTICDGDVYSFGGLMLSEEGHYIDTFKTVSNCDSIVSLDLEVLGMISDTVNDKMFEGETYMIGQHQLRQPGIYPVTLTSHQGCDSLVLLHLEYYHVFIPNVFSPNDDGINDVFSVLGGEDMLESHIRIYDRWGNLIYQGDQWNGKWEDAALSPGVYTYQVRVEMTNGHQKQFHGTVTLVR
jgi:gliding motility-associated-like protein